MTYSIIGLNVAAYIAIYVASKLLNIEWNSAIIIFGAKVNPWIVNYNQWWRLFTCMFVHADLVHIFCNCLSLYFYGPVTELLYGRWKFLVIYFSSGVFAALLSMILSTNPAVGASGAIFGALGSLLYLWLRAPELFKSIFGKRLIIILAANLAYGFANSSIDNWGHIGGLAGGFLVAAVIGLYGDKKLSKLQILGIVGMVLLFAGMCFLGRLIVLQRGA